MTSKPLFTALRRRVEQVQSGIGLLRGLWASSDRQRQLRRLRTLLAHRADHDRLQDALFYYRLTTALLFAHRLGLFGLLEAGPRSAAELAAQGGVGEGAAEVLLRILEANGFVARAGQGYGLSPFGKEFLGPSGAVSYAPLLDFMVTFAGSFDAMTESLATGQVPARLDIFSGQADVKAMLGAVNVYLDSAGRELLERAALPELGSFIVGSMGVSMSALLLERFPRSKVTYGCLPHLVAHIPDLRAQYGVDPARVTGMHGHGGEPDQDRWGDEAFDLVLLTKKMILRPHERLGEKFARKAFRVLNPGGVAVFWEVLFEEDARTPLAPALESVLDLSVSPVGCVWTRQRFVGLLVDVGFARVELLRCMRGETTFVIAHKAR